MDLHDGTYECSCFYGFALAVDGYSCTKHAVQSSTRNKTIVRVNNKTTKKSKTLNGEIPSGGQFAVPLDQVDAMRSSTAAAAATNHRNDALFVVEMTTRASRAPPPPPSLVDNIAQLKRRRHFAGRKLDSELLEGDVDGQMKTSWSSSSSSTTPPPPLVPIYELDNDGAADSTQAFALGDQHELNDNEFNGLRALQSQTKAEEDEEEAEEDNNDDEEQQRTQDSAATREQTTTTTDEDGRTRTGDVAKGKAHIAFNFRPTQTHNARMQIRLARARLMSGVHIAS